MNLQAGQTRGVFDAEAFDSAAVEALQFYQRNAGIIIEDNDPNPNEIRKIRLSTPLGQWDVILSDKGIWEIDGTPVGPNVTRECEMMCKFQAAQGEDLRNYQGEEAAQRYSR